MHACACTQKRKEERENDPDGTSRCPRCHDGSFVLKTRRTDNKACREAGSPKRRMRCAPIRVTRSTHVCHQEHTPLWRYAQRWWRWQRAGLDGRVSLKGGLKRVVIRQLRLLGIVGFPIPKYDAQTGTWKMRASSASG